VARSPPLAPNGPYRAGSVDRSPTDLWFRRRPTKVTNLTVIPSAQNTDISSCLVRPEKSGTLRCPIRQQSDVWKQSHRIARTSFKSARAQLSADNSTIDSGSSSFAAELGSLTPFFEKAESRDPDISIRVAFRAIDLIQHLTVGFVIFASTDRFQTGGSKANETSTPCLYRSVDCLRIQRVNKGFAAHKRWYRLVARTGALAKSASKCRKPRSNVCSGRSRKHEKALAL